jgi:hypothetical protein
METYPNSNESGLENGLSVEYLLQGLLSPDKSFRNSCEEYYTKLKSKNYSLLVFNLVSSLPNLPDLSTKQLACTLIRQAFMYKLNAEIWENLSLDMRESIVNVLLNYAKIEKNIIVLKSLADALIEYNHSVYLNHKQISIEILELALDSCCSNGNLGYLGFSILSGYFGYFYDYFQHAKESLFRNFEIQLKSENLEIKYACTNAFLSMIIAIDTPETMYFSQLLPDLLKSLISLPDSEVLFINLRDASEAEPLFFYKRLLICFEFTDKILSSAKTTGSKYLSCDFLCEICIKFPETPKHNIAKALELIEKFMSSLEINFSDNTEINFLDLASDLFFKIAEAHKSYLKEILLELCSNINNKGDYGYFIGLIKLQKIVKLLSSELALVVSVLQNVDNQYCKWAVAKCIGSVWKNLYVEYIDIHQLLLMNLELVQSRSPVVCAEASNSLINFVEKLPKRILKKYSGVFFEFFATTDPEIWLEVMAALIKRVPKTIPAASVIETLVPMLGTEKGFLAVQCLIPLHEYSPINSYLPKIILFLKLLNRQLELNSLEYWELLIKHLPKEMSEYLPYIFPDLLKIIKKNIENPTDDFENYLSSFLCVLKYSYAYSALYLEDSYKVSLELLKYPSNDVKCIAACIAPVIIKNMRKLKIKGTAEIARTYMKEIIMLYELSPDCYCRIQYITAATSILSIFKFPFCFNEEAQTISEKLSSNIISSTDAELLIQECKFSAHLIYNHPDDTTKLIDTIETLFLYNKAPKIKDHYSLVSLLCEILNIIGNCIPSRLYGFLNVFLNFSEAVDERVRNKAIQGLGIIVSLCPQEFFQSVGKDIMRVLENCLQNFSRFNHRYFIKARNSAVLTIGVIIKLHRQNFQISTVVEWWIGFLPLWTDKHKNKTAMDLLSEIVKENPTDICRLSEEGLNHLKQLLSSQEDFDEIS